MGSSGNATEDAERMERERQAKINQSTAAIESAFSNPAREAQYADFSNANRAFYTDDLNRKQKLNARNLKFAMSRNGQVGSSVAVDRNKDAAEIYQRGALEVDRRTQGAEASLRDQDQAARLNLLAMAQSGMDANTSANQAALSIQNNIRSGAASAKADGLGDLFGSLSDVYRRSQEDAERRRGEKWLYGLMYGGGAYGGYGNPQGD